MVKVNEVYAYFQATCFPQKFVGVQVGFGAGGTLDPSETQSEAEMKLYERCKRRTEHEIRKIMNGELATTVRNDDN